MFMLLLTLSACHEQRGPQTPGDEDLWKRAAFDLNCPQRALRYVELSEKTVGVRGCSQQVVYLQVCNETARWQCNWVLNSRVEAIPTQAPPQQSVPPAQQASTPAAAPPQQAAPATQKPSVPQSGAL
jgi:hypothetical protein